MSETKPLSPEARLLALIEASSSNEKAAARLLLVARIGVENMLREPVAPSIGKTAIGPVAGGETPVVPDGADQHQAEPTQAKTDQTEAVNPIDVSDEVWEGLSAGWKSMKPAHKQDQPTDWVH